MLVRNIFTKYGIQEADIYNFDETGFLLTSIYDVRLTAARAYK